MLARILMAGSGGQGVLTAGNILANAAMLGNYNVTFLPSYGAAMRGGTANCTICISDEDIASPVASVPDFVIAMNQPSAETFINKLESGGFLMYNSSLISSIPFRGDIEISTVPAGEIAGQVANERSSNMVILGAFIKFFKILGPDYIYKSIEEMLGKKPKLVEISKKAFDAGYNGFPFENK